MSSRCYSCAYYNSGICKITGSFPYTGNDCGNYVPEIVVKVEHHERKKDDYLQNVVVELRTTKRALWLARAERAGCEQDYLRKMFEHYEDYYNVKTGKDFTKEYCDSVWNKWCWVEMKCREKAEEYL